MWVHGFNIATLIVLAFVSEYLYLKHQAKKKKLSLKQQTVIRSSLRTSLIVLLAYMVYVQLV